MLKLLLFANFTYVSVVLPALIRLARVRVNQDTEMRNS